MGSGARSRAVLPPPPHPPPLSPRVQREEAAVSRPRRPARRTTRLSHSPRSRSLCRQSRITDFLLSRLSFLTRVGKKRGESRLWGEEETPGSGTIMVALLPGADGAAPPASSAHARRCAVELCAAGRRATGGSRVGSAPLKLRLWFFRQAKWRAEGAAVSGVGIRLPGGGGGHIYVCKMGPGD